MTAVHRCPDCRCSPDEQPPPPATSSPGIRRAVIEHMTAPMAARPTPTDRAKAAELLADSGIAGGYGPHDAYVRDVAQALADAREEGRRSVGDFLRQQVPKKTLCECGHRLTDHEPNDGPCTEWWRYPEVLNARKCGCSRPWIRPVAQEIR